MGLEKRGLSKSGISLIIIVIVLVAAVLIYALFREKEEKPSSVSEQCAYFCQTNQSTSFCTFKVSASDTLRVTCNELLTNSQYSSYGVKVCPAISCSTQETGGTQPLDQACVSGLGGTWEQSSETGRCVQSGEKVRRVLTPSDSPPVAGQICCK